MLQAKCKNLQVSNMCGRQPSFFVLGPVGQTSPKYHKNLFTFNAAETDRTIRWTKIEEVKLKTLEQREACALSTVVVLGSKQARRGVEGLAKRHAGEERRVGMRHGRQWKPRAS